MTVLVAIPAWHAAGTVQKAVDSALAQRERDVRVVVVGDGEEPAVTPDPRVTVYTLPENRGTYFCRQLMLLASPWEWHAPLDADDYLDPKHLTYLRSHLAGTEAVLPNKVRGWIPERGPRVYGAGRYHVGLMSTRRMLEVGGYSPEERIGADTLLLRLLALTGPVRTVSQPTYNRVRVPTSLTMDPASSHRSTARNEMKVRNREVYRRARLLRDPAAIAEYRRTLVPTWLATELEDHASRLRSMLAAPQAVAA